MTDIPALTEPEPDPAQQLLALLTGAAWEPGVEHTRWAEAGVWHVLAEHAGGWWVTHPTGPVFVELPAWREHLTNGTPLPVPATMASSLLDTMTTQCTDVNDLVRSALDHAASTPEPGEPVTAAVTAIAALRETLTALMSELLATLPGPAPGRHSPAASRAGAAAPPAKPTPARARRTPKDGVALDMAAVNAACDAKGTTFSRACTAIGAGGSARPWAKDQTRPTITAARALGVHLGVPAGTLLAPSGRTDPDRPEVVHTDRKMLGFFLSYYGYFDVNIDPWDHLATDTGLPRDVLRAIGRWHADPTWLLLERLHDRYGLPLPTDIPPAYLDPDDPDRLVDVDPALLRAALSKTWISPAVGGEVTDTVLMLLTHMVGTSSDELLDALHNTHLIRRITLHRLAHYLTAPDLLTSP